MGLGCWLIAITLTFFSFYTSLFVSDLLVGLLFIACGLLSLSPKRIWSRWMVGLLGVWLQFAPLIFWASSPVTYFNDTLVGAIAIVFSFIMTKKNNEDESLINCCPIGWSYNPSSWGHRIPVVFLAMVCWFFARYMAAYQLGYISHIWDPFFPEGTLDVITSDVSRAFPVSDAGLGALCYTIETLLGWQGGKCRFATMPWVVFSFAFLVIPVGAVSIFLIILQPIVVGAWCSWCLATALCMLIMIVFTAGEFAALLQFLLESKQKGQSLWRLFWKGGTASNIEVYARLKRRGLRGITIPWNLVISALLGLALMMMPGLLGIKGEKLAISDYIEGPIVLAISVISMAEVFRTLRYCLIGFGAWLIVAPWIISSLLGGIVCHLIVGVLLILLSLRKGNIKEKYGVWDRLIF